MDDRISVPVSLPLDNDGFLRRECPTCEKQFKWFSHESGDLDAEDVDQYFCPLCGVPASVDSWWTPSQLEYAEGVAGPEIERAMQDAIGQAFKGVKGVSFKANRGFGLELDAPEPPPDPDDMVIVEAPCHPNEPLKVPEDAADRVHCLVCGSLFAT